MNISRRWFIGGAASFGAFAGCRFFESRAFRAGGRPNLVFGVVSDIHVSQAACPGEGILDNRNDLTFRRALEWFRDQGVDAVMVAGDMANNGLVEQLEAIAAAWYDVFPDDRAPDGRRVERLFIYGNHDYHGHLYGGYGAKFYPEAAELRRHVLRADMGGWWRRLFHEDYSPFYRKDVRGYTFLGQHWDDGRGLETGFGKCPDGSALRAFLSAQGRALDPARPFFYFQHPHLRDTCYGPWAWGRDNGLPTRALSAHPNAIAFSGHSHYSLTDERSVWQGAFTSVGAGSLRYTGLPDGEFPGEGYENGASEGPDARRLDAQKAMPKFNSTDSRQGMLWRVYDDCIVVRRHEFLSGLDLGADWVLPLPTAEAKPFAFAARAKVVGTPEFPVGAALSIRRIRATSRGAKARKGEAEIARVAREAVEIAIPAVVEAEAARAFRLEVEVAPKAGGASVVRRVLASGFNQSARHPKARAVTRCVLARDTLPPGDCTVRVTPVNCFGRAGRALEAPLVAARGR